MKSKLGHHFITIKIYKSKQGSTKCQLISKAKRQAVDSPKKQTNEFAFFDLKSCYVVKSKLTDL